MKNVTVELLIDQYALERYVKYLGEDEDNRLGNKLTKVVRANSIDHLYPPEGAVDYAYELLLDILEQSRGQ